MTHEHAVKSGIAKPGVDPEDVARAAGLVPRGNGIWTRPEILKAEEEYGKPYSHPTCGSRWRSKDAVKFCPGCGENLANIKIDDGLPIAWRNDAMVRACIQQMMFQSETVLAGVIAPGFSLRDIHREQQEFVSGLFDLLESRGFVLTRRYSHIGCDMASGSDFTSVVWKATNEAELMAAAKESQDKANVVIPRSFCFPEPTAAQKEQYKKLAEVREKMWERTSKNHSLCSECGEAFETATMTIVQGEETSLGLRHVVRICNECHPKAAEEAARQSSERSFYDQDIKKSLLEAAKRINAATDCACKSLLNGHEPGCQVGSK